MTEKVFAVGDIHGCAPELEELIDKLPLDDNSRIVFLGDLVDRGPESKEVIDFIIELSKKHKVTTLLGNHEAMMLEFFKDPSSPLAGYFILNGGNATLASYVNADGEDYTLPSEHLEFLKQLPISFETDTHFFVHAGVPQVKLKRLNEEKYRNEMLWIRDSFLNSDFKWEKIIVHGHTPYPEPEIRHNRINLDTGCVFNGHLTAMEVNSGEIYQVKSHGLPPHLYLKSDPNFPRVAKRFLGSIPVFVESEQGYVEYTTINYNEFGLLIVEINGSDKAFEIGQILKGKIGASDRMQVDFVGQVVRHQKKDQQIAYGVKMLEPLSKKKDLSKSDS